MDKKKVMVIVNPVSGARHRRPERFGASLDRSFGPSDFTYELHFTKRAGHAADIALAGLEAGIKYFLVAGGDGTVNEVARMLRETGSVMGIIPSGSGNGLAHHLGIPVSVDKALAIFKKQKTVSIDTCTINDRFFISIAGIGFDARVARQFAKNNRRGFWAYARIVMSEYFQYKPESFELLFDGQTLVTRAFFISFANSSQFGYNTRIAPGASLTDGLLDVCIVQKPPLKAFPQVARLLFSWKADRSKYMKTFRTSSITVNRMKGKTVNVDGEAIRMEKKLNIQVLPSSLNIVIP